MKHNLRIARHWPPLMKYLDLKKEYLAIPSGTDDRGLEPFNKDGIQPSATSSGYHVGNLHGSLPQAPSGSYANTNDGVFHHGHRQHHRNCHSDPTDLGIMHPPHLMPPFMVHPFGNDFAPVFGVFDPRQYQPIGPPGSNLFMMQPQVYGPLTQHGLALMHQAGFASIPNPAYFNAPMEFGPLPPPMQVPMQPPAPAQNNNVRPYRRGSGRHAAGNGRPLHTARQNPSMSTILLLTLSSTFNSDLFIPTTLVSPPSEWAIALVVRALISPWAAWLTLDMIQLSCT